MGRPIALLRHVVILVILFLTLFPIYWLLSTIFKRRGEWLAYPPVWLPELSTRSLVNFKVLFGIPVSPEEITYIGILGQGGLSASGQILSSLIIAGFGSLLATIVGFFAAYAVSRHRTGGTPMLFFVLLSRMLPGAAVAIPMILMYSWLGMLDQYYSMVILYGGVSVAYVLWMMRSFIDEVPREVELAAQLDGLSPVKTLFRITLPLVKGGMIASGIFVFILNWSEFLFAVVLTDKVQTIPVRLLGYQSQGGYLLGPMAALSAIAMAPVILFGYLIQKHLARGLTFGAVRQRR